MHFSTLLPAFYLLVSAASASAIAIAGPTVTADQQAAQVISPSNHYGAPIPPWEPGSKPGWYYGRPEYAPQGLVCLVDGLLCLILDLLGLCPSVPPTVPPPTPPTGSPPVPPSLPQGYDWIFTNLTCALQSLPQDYDTFGIVETVQDCANMCNTLSNCICANSYHDNNAGAGKGDTTQLTCALFNAHLTAVNATNCGNQQQQAPPVGTTYITESYGFCKIGE